MQETNKGVLFDKPHEPDAIFAALSTVGELRWGIRGRQARALLDKLTETWEQTRSMPILSEKDTRSVRKAVGFMINHASDIRGWEMPPEVLQNVERLQAGFLVLDTQRTLRE